MLRELEYKADVREAAERMAAFWEKRELDRPAIWITASRDEPLPGPEPPAPPSDPVAIWADQEYRLAAGEHGMRRVWFLAESFPVMQTHLGPGSLAIHLGSEPVFQPSTVWYEPCFDSLPGSPDLSLHPDEHWWRWTLEFTRRACTEGAGRWVVAFPDLIENLDILASLRGSLELLTDLVDCPEDVHRYQRQILELYMVAYDELATLQNIPAQGSVFVSFPGWSPGRVCKLQCDMSCMISPDAFREFVQPYLRSQCRRIDHCFYHLDGPGAVCHLPALLEIDELHGIQWTPGAGVPNVDDERWWPLYDEIQAAGKSTFILGVAPGNVKRLLDRFDPQLTFLSTHCASRQEAEGILSSVS